MWPTATIDLVNLVQSSQDQNCSKLLYRFMLRTLLILDEEVVERAESKLDGERIITTNVKDAMRVESVHSILTLMTSVLTQY